MTKINLAELLFKASHLFNAQNFCEAETVLDKIFEHLPNEPQALHLMGCIYKAKGDFNKSIKFLKRSIEFDNSNPISFLNLGKVYRQKGDIYSAARYFQESLVRSQQVPETWICFGHALRDIQQSDKAIQAYRNAMLLNPSNEVLIFNLASFLRQDGDNEAAEQILLLFNSINPHNAKCLFSLGSIYFDLGNFREATKLFLEVISIEEHHIEARFSLAKSLLQLGLFNQASECLSLLSNSQPLDEEKIINFGSLSLVFDWHHRRIQYLKFQLEVLANTSLSSNYTLVRKAANKYLPSLFIRDQGTSFTACPFRDDGFSVDTSLIQQSICSDLVLNFSRMNSSHDELITELLDTGVLNRILSRINELTGLPHLIWSCVLSATCPDDVKDAYYWHYDNHYNDRTPKVMIYLNSQDNFCGATEFISYSNSNAISLQSDYMGLVPQRKPFQYKIQELASKLSTSFRQSNSAVYCFSPKEAGSAIWFYPSRVLHRGVPPIHGIRYVLSFSLTPLPVDCGWDLNKCIEKSVFILQDKFHSLMCKSDINPYWTF